KDNNGETMLAPYTYTFATSKSFDSGGKCPCTIWPDVRPTGVSDAADSSPINLGVQFRASSDGTITGVRFYKEPDNTGAHTGSLWSSTGMLLATGTFSGEGASGWQELDFSTPVPVTAGTTYVASYHTGAGHYALTSGGLSSAVVNGPLTALAGGGVYAYGSGNVFPSSSFNASNYWVDAVYTPASGGTPPVVSGVTPDDGSSGNPGSVAFNTGDTVATFTPDSPLAAGTTYTATVSGAQNSSGTPMSGSKSWSFTVSASSQCPCSIWPGTAQPSVASASDPSPVNVGVKFTADTGGSITGIRFYKG